MTQVPRLRAFPRFARLAILMAVAALALPLLMTPLGAVADTSAVATDDAYTTSTRPSHNSGASTKVAVGADGAAQKVGYFKFTRPSVNPGDAELVLTVTGGTAGTLRVHTTGPDWSDRTITAANAPALGQLVGQSAVNGGQQTVRIPLDSVGRTGSISLAVTRTDGGITRIASKEASTTVAARLTFVDTAPPPNKGSRPVNPGTSTMPIYTSPAPDSGTYIESYEARLAQGWATGFYTYWPGDIKWNSEWSQFVSRHPEGIPVVGSPKGVNPTNVKTFLDGLPQNWRDKWIMAYYQEPEDNFTTPAQRAQYRANVAQMAELVRPYGVKNAVHLQEWTIHPNNNKPWGGEANLAQFINAEDIDYISWSLYPREGESMRAGIDRIKAFSETYAPGVPWGVTAGASPVSPSAPIGGTARLQRAAIALDGANYVAEVGGDAFGWFDWDSYLPGQDNLVSKDPALRSAMLSISEIQLP